MKKIVVEPTSDIVMTQEDFDKLTGGIKFDRNDIPVKDVASDEDVIMNLCWENKKLKDILGEIDDTVVKPLEEENIKYHNTLLCLYNVVKCLKLNEQSFANTNLEFRDLFRVMNNAEKMLKEENHN